MGVIVAREREAPVLRKRERDFRVILSPRLQRTASPFLSVGTADVYPGQCTPCHVHEVEQETWYVTEGHGVVVVGTETVDAGPGTVVVAPAGVPHQLVNLSATEHFKTVVMFTPAGPEEMFLPRPGDGGEEE